jgi:acyl carrier protein
VKRDAVMVELTKILEEGFGIERQAITPAATFRGTLRLDSIDVLNLIEDVESAFKISADVAEYRDLHEISKLVDFIVARTNS